MEEVREPQFAGEFYEEEKNLLEQEITNAFHHGPGDEPVGVHEDEELYGALVPVIRNGHVASVAAWAYKELAESKRPEVIVLLGPSPTGKTASSKIHWRTALGEVESDQETAFKMMAAGIPILEEEHNNPHLEVHIPYLQHIFKGDVPPIVFCNVGEDVSFRGLAKVLRGSLGRKHFWCLVSTDLTRYGTRFNNVPFVYNVKESIDRLDGSVMKSLEKMDGNHFLGTVEKERCNMQGKVALAAALELVKEFGQAETVAYFNSGDITGKYDECIGHGAAVFR